MSNRMNNGRPKAGLLLLALSVMLVPSAALAREMTSAEVRTAAETWVRNLTVDARPDAQVAMLEPHRVGGQTVAYIAHLEGGGYCLCGADDHLLPVYF